MALASYRLEISTFAILEVDLYQVMVLNQYLTGVEREIVRGHTAASAVRYRNRGASSVSGSVTSASARACILFS